MEATRESKATRKAEAKERLGKILAEGATVYTVLRSRSRSGMSRCMDVFTFTIDEKTGQPVKHWLTGSCVAMGIGTQSRTMWERSQGMRVNGCGMDMGFHVVNWLESALSLKLRHEWI